ncbi:hypothetical protein ABW19_dt0202792 [Dactylella cylindrospora]|nr:hypothetical protein ABW19_dt0202792 [Dactylella cylindrospora]
MFPKLHPDTRRRLIFVIHVIQFALVGLAIILSIVKITLPDVPRSRMDTWVIGVSAKSLVIMSYMVLTERISKLKRYASLKANMVLSIIETVFWIAAFYFTVRGISQCQKQGCSIGTVLIIAIVLLIVLSVPIVCFCIQDYRFFRKNGYSPQQAQSYSMEDSDTTYKP